MYNKLKIFFSTVLVFLGAFIIGFGFWFLLFWFFTGNFDLFTWPVFVKIFYVILSLTSVSGILEIDEIN